MQQRLFNPKNNVNAFTDPLDTTPPPGGKPRANGSKRLKFYHSVADGETGLFNAQKAYYEKIIEVTHDLDNIYYELVHEIATNYSDWSKTSQWLEAMAKGVREKWSQLEPDREIILGTDAGLLKGFPYSQAGGLPEEGSEIDWVFSRPYFNIIVWGNAHHVANARAWRRRYKKPYVAQESADDIAKKWSYRHPEMRVHTRKYFWKLMMGKVQQMDLYMKRRSGYPKRPGYPHNYDPNGWNSFEDDALKLREFWNSLHDYPSLRFEGGIFIGPVGHQLVLSSSKEAVIYVSSPTGLKGKRYTRPQVRLKDMPLPDGSYAAHFFDPARGEVGTEKVTIRHGGEAKFHTPDYTDDMAIHIYK